MNRMFNRVVVLTTVFLCTVHSFGQTSDNEKEARALTTQDSILCFLDSAFSLIRSKALYAGKIDWATDSPSFYKEALSKKTFKESLTVFKRVFEKMEDAHSTVWMDSTAFKGGDHLREERSVNQELQHAYQNGEAKLMAKRIGDFGYIRIPYINTNSDVELENSYSQKIQNMVCEIYSPEIKGWILDLRLNGGGDMYPMITGIQQLKRSNLFINWRGFSRLRSITSCQLMRMPGITCGATAAFLRTSIRWNLNWTTRKSGPGSPKCFGRA